MQSGRQALCFCWLPAGLTGQETKQFSWLVASNGRNQFGSNVRFIFHSKTREQALLRCTSSFQKYWTTASVNVLFASELSFVVETSIMNLKLWPFYTMCARTVWGQEHKNRLHDDDKKRAQRSCSAFIHFEVHAKTKVFGMAFVEARTLARHLDFPCKQTKIVPQRYKSELLKH